MVARIAGSMVVSVAVLIVVSLLVSFGVLWWTGSVLTSTAIGTMCGLVAAFTVNTLHNGEEGVHIEHEEFGSFPFGTSRLRRL